MCKLHLRNSEIFEKSTIIVSTDHSCSLHSLLTSVQNSPTSLRFSALERWCLVYIDTSLAPILPSVAVNHHNMQVNISRYSVMTGGQYLPVLFVMS